MLFNQTVAHMKHFSFAVAVCSTLCMPMSASAYVLAETTFPGGVQVFKWGAPGYGTGASVTWSVIQGGTDCSAVTFVPCSTAALADFIPSNHLATIQHAFDTWSSVADLSFARVPDDGAAVDAITKSGDIRIGGFSFTNSNFNSAGGIGFYPTMHQFFGGVLVGTGNNSLTGDVFFNTDLAGGFSDTAFLSQLAAHEIGHALGLGHSDVAGSVLSANGLPAFAGLGADDIAGVQFIYGAHAAAVPEPAAWALFACGLAGLALRRTQR